MAFTQNYSVPSFGQQDDEEEKRRQQELQAQEEARLQALGQSVSPVAPEQPTQFNVPAEVPAVPSMPQPGEPTQVAGPAQLSTLPQQTVQSQNIPTVQAEKVEVSPNAFNQMLIDAQGSPDKLANLYASKELKPEQKQLVGSALHDVLNQNNQKQKAEEQLKTMSPNELSRMLSSKSTEGSWGKAIMYGLLGMENAAKDEASKLGIGAKWTSVTLDGKPAIVKVRSDGLPMEGYNSETGQKLDAKQLTQAMTGQLGKHVSTTAETYIDQAGNRYRSQTDERGNARMVNIATGQPFSGDASKLQRQLDVSSMARVDYGLATDLLKKHSGNVLDMMKEYETIKGPMTPEARQEFMQRYGYGTTVKPPEKPTTAMPTAPAQGPVAPGQAPAAPTTAPAAAPTTATKLPSGGVKLSTGASAPSTGGAITGLTGGAGAPAGGTGSSIAGLKQNMAISQKAAEERIQVAGKRSESFNKILDEEVRPQAQAGDTVSQVRKQQFEIFNRPGIDSNKLFGLYNAAGEGPGAQKFTIIRDIFGGIFKPEAEVSQRLAQLDLTPQEKSALMEYNIANQRINAATLKQTAGPGSVSDAEQRANREANVDPTKIPALGAYNAMAQSQFSGDLARYKADWADKQPATNALQLDKAWRKESQQLSQMYGDIAKKRAEYIVNNGATTNAVKEGYKRFPIPEYDPQTETWKKTKPLADILGR